jgi:2-polyprenyl-3-methyl-5-hydroxy-6-metoxy-1,4-benzoquinol methylase
MNASRAAKDLQRIDQSGGVEAYSSKDAAYFAGARRDYVAELPRNANGKILEVGCASGMTGALALSEGKCGFYCGIEICEGAAENAKSKINEVLLGNVETLELPWDPETFDALILSEVLEHLVDPWTTLRKLRPLLKSGSLVFASSPNISYYRVISMLAGGKWTLTDFGPMDRTHLRWFTPDAYRNLFESCNYQVDGLREHQPLGKKAHVIDLLTFGRFKYLFIEQIDLRAHCV